MRGLGGCRNDGKGNIYCTPPPATAYYENAPCPDIYFQAPPERFDLAASVAAKASAQWSPNLLRWQGMLGATLIAAVGATVYLRRR